MEQVPGGYTPFSHDIPDVALLAFHQATAKLPKPGYIRWR